MPQHRTLTQDPAAEWLGVEILRADPGHAALRMTVRPEMANGFGITHGGMVFALADTCFAMTCNHPSEDDGTVTVASGVDIDYLAPTRVSDVLVAEGRLLAQAGRSGLCDITVTRDDRTVAVFRGRHRTIPAPRA